MPKALCIVGSILATVSLLVFGLDLAIAIPFHRISLAMDIGMVVCALAVGFGSWTTLREQR